MSSIHESPPSRFDGSLYVTLGIHVLIMTISVQLEYHEPIFTLLIGTVYGPVLAATILLVCIDSMEYCVSGDISLLTAHNITARSGSNKSKRILFE